MAQQKAGLSGPAFLTGQGIYNKKFLKPRKKGIIMRRKEGFTPLEINRIKKVQGARVKKQAKAVMCQSNLKQMGAAASMYTNDNDGYFQYGNWPPSPGATKTHRTRWTGAMEAAGWQNLKSLIAPLN